MKVPKAQTRAAMKEACTMANSGVMPLERSITSSEAKAGLGELLSSLATDGPVEITRNGRPVAVLSAPTAGLSPVEASRPAELARLYAAGKLTWREIASEADIAFGDLLVELAKQYLRLPRVMPSKRPEQLAMLRGIFEREARQSRELSLVEFMRASPLTGREDIDLERAP